MIFELGDAIRGSYFILNAASEDHDLHGHLQFADRTNTYIPSLDRLRKLLQSLHLYVHLSIGEALAVIFEF